MSFQFTAEQEAIFDFYRNSSENMMIEAVAGSGKTFTIVQLVKMKASSHVFLAFNKSIQLELKSRQVRAFTFHGFLKRPVLEFFKQEDVIPNKLVKLQRFVKGFTREEMKDQGTSARELVSKMKNVGFGYYHNIDDLEKLDKLARRFNINPKLVETDIEADMKHKRLRMYQLAQELLRLNNESPMCDFDDLIYQALRWNIRIPTFQNVFVDEAQDTNAIQIGVIHKILGDTGRLIVVGDSNQAIYGFRGASSESMSRLAREFKTRPFPLHTTFRCGTSIVEHANEYVKEIHAAPGAHKGEVRVVKMKDLKLTEFTNGTLVLSRLRARLFSLAIRLIAHGQSVFILGEDAPEKLISIYKSFKVDTVGQTIWKAEQWRVAKRAEAKSVNAGITKLHGIDDTAQSLKVLSSSMDYDAPMENLYDLIRTLFTYRKEAVMISTIHSAKGLEADKVIWLNSDECPLEYGEQDWEKQQERNLIYVAITRAKSLLIKGLR
ncbi:UvrD-like DNA helicase, C-terminal [uncultured Caudovirales phage]|uniref:DNA 3'-5' helicase n=1 Tax=uncultured Caudovirales phage TaxID=2100421 RepID=A0A6J5L022_9CAUD|nr:UvrD-like DNA helicase, C-terminal [uncultured Caudovirales phage]